VVAIYNGAASFNGSAGDINYTVSKAATTTTITGDTPDPSLVGKTKSMLRTAFQSQVDGLGFSIVEVLSTCPVGWGMTPLTVAHLPPGAKRVRLTKPGYRSEERVVGTDPEQPASSATAATAASEHAATRLDDRGHTRM